MEIPDRTLHNPAPVADVGQVFNLPGQKLILIPSEDTNPKGFANWRAG